MMKTLSKIIIFSMLSVAWKILTVEGQRVSSTSDPNIFTCDDGSSIPFEYFCDGISNCVDGSDERSTLITCENCQYYEASCHLRSINRTCLIHRDYICNGTITCHAGAQCDAGCPTHYRCQNQACKARNTLCNDDSCDGCSEDDDWETGIGFQCVRRGKYCRLPQQLLWDGVEDCEQGADLCYSSALHIQEGRDLRSHPSTKFNHSLCFICLDYSMIVPRHKVCDGVIDCSDLSDECVCEKERLPDICNHVKTRTSSLDYPLSSDLNACEIGQVSCGNGICINRTSICDSVSDCPDNRDERFSYCQGTMLCKDGLTDDAGARCRCDTNCYTISANLCDGIGDCPPPGTSPIFRARWVAPPGFPADECVANCSLQTGSHFNCTIGHAAVSSNPPFVTLCKIVIEIEAPVFVAPSPTSTALSLAPPFPRTLLPSLLPSILPPVTFTLPTGQRPVAPTMRPITLPHFNMSKSILSPSNAVRPSIPPNILISSTSPPIPTPTRRLPVPPSTFSSFLQFNSSRPMAPTFHLLRPSLPPLTLPPVTMTLPTQRLLVSPSLTSPTLSPPTVSRLTLPSISPRRQIIPNPTAIAYIAVPREARCNGIVDCPQGQQDENGCEVNFNRFYCKSNNLINIPTSSLCDGHVDCDNGDDEIETNCTERFYCPSLNGAQVSIPIANKCDFIINCDDSRDEINCTDDGRFYCESRNPLFVRKRQVFDGRGDCSDLSDECPINSNTRIEDPFASRYQLIANPILRAIVWIMGLLAVFGNGIVIITESVKLRKEQLAAIRANRMLVLNLAISDFLMGLYLIILGIVGAVYSGVYCANELQWLSSSTCSTLGVLVVVSSETSVVTLALLTSVRLFALSKPFSSRIKPTQQQILIAIFLSWTFSLLLAFIPFASSLQYLYTDKALVNNNPFFQNATVQFSSAMKWTEKLLTFDTKYSFLSNDVISQIREAKSWSELQTILGYTKTSPQTLEISRYYGYYSANSVCIPRLFVTREDNSWQFSLAITTFNFLAFTYVACTYIYIIFLSRKKMAKTSNAFSERSKRLNQIKVMQNRILRLVVTDFCCWVPISIMAFINFSGVPVSSLAYAVSAILLLPINSALNPILYSNLITTIREKIRKQVASQHTSGLSTSNSSTTRGTKQTVVTRV